MRRLHILFFLACQFAFFSAFGIVKYDEGREFIDGVQLLQDHKDELAYYYLPQFPKLVEKADGTFEILCIKYNNSMEDKKELNGGLFHALVEFSLPEEVKQSVQRKLEDKYPGARIVGPVPMMQAIEDGVDGQASIKLISSILNEGKFTQKVITSGHAPLLPGSKAAIAANLSQEGATLLWRSLESNTSDISIGISGHYQAYIQGYNATVRAEMETIHKYFKRVMSNSEGYNRQYIRKLTDELRNNKVLEVEVFDASKGAEIKTEDMAGILDIVTTKLVEYMFTDQPMPAKKEIEHQVKRQKRGWFSKVFGGARNEKYETDQQYVLRKELVTRAKSFYLNLSKSTTIKVPFSTSGNLSGIYEDLGDDNRYFRVVDLHDPVFEHREIKFRIGANYMESFKTHVEKVSVRLKKAWTDDFVKSHTFDSSFLDTSSTKTITYGKGEDEISRSEFNQYRYQEVWQMRDGTTKTSNWKKEIENEDITLFPPFKMIKLKLDADLDLFDDQNKTANVVFTTQILGQERTKSFQFRKGDEEGKQNSFLYFDEGSSISYKVTWYPSGAKTNGTLDGDYIYITPTQN